MIEGALVSVYLCDNLGGFSENIPRHSFLRRVAFLGIAKHTIIMEIHNVDIGTL